MDTNEKKLNSAKTDGPACNVTYAQVLSRGSDTSDSSNNNPSEIVNGNQCPSETNELPTISVDSNLELSQSDSFEDADDSQFVNSSSTVRSSELVPNTTEETSSLVTAESDTKPSDQYSDSQSSECSDSGEEADLEEEAFVVDDAYPSSLKWRLRTVDKDFQLPKTVTVLETEQGSKVFVVGTAHFSKESQEDVAKTIRAVQPDVVLIELCKNRINILSMDEEMILEESKNMNFQKMRAAIEQNGVVQGVLYLLLLNMSAHLTKQLGMAPGGEFRRAFLEAKQIPGCLVHLGDRPIHITLQRALGKLSWWQKLRIAWYMLRTKDISAEEIEKCKQKDLLEEMLAEMTGEFPELSHVFVKERDIYLTYSLQMSAVSLPSPHTRETVSPSYVVGVVGLGHVPGIVENWGKVTEKDIPPILNIPEPTLAGRIVRRSIRLSVLGLGLYGMYRLLPKTWIPERPFHFISMYFKR